jgi:hypothetical protein
MLSKFRDVDDCCLEKRISNNFVDAILNVPGPSACERSRSAVRSLRSLPPFKNHSFDTPLRRASTPRSHTLQPFHRRDRFMHASQPKAQVHAKGCPLLAMSFDKGVRTREEEMFLGDPQF